MTAIQIASLFRLEQKAFLPFACNHGRSREGTMDGIGLPNPIAEQGPKSERNQRDKNEDAGNDRNHAARVDIGRFAAPDIGAHARAPPKGKNRMTAQMANAMSRIANIEGAIAIPP